MIELNANGAILNRDMAKRIRWQMYRKDIEPDHASAAPETKSQILNTFEACDVTVHTFADEFNMRSLPEQFAGVPFAVSEIVPPGEIWFFVKGELVGKIKGLARIAA